MTLCTTRPIQSKRQALSLLKRGFGDGTLRYVRSVRQMKLIAVESYTRSREELEFVNEYEISSEIFGWLKTERLIIGTPYWGGRNTWEFEPTPSCSELAWTYELTPIQPGEEELACVYDRPAISA